MIYIKPTIALTTASNYCALVVCTTLHTHAVAGRVDPSALTLYHISGALHEVSAHRVIGTLRGGS